jgi:hypothetical protein
MINYLQEWMDQLRWQRLKPFGKLADTLLKHLDGIANYCRIKVRMGVVEAVNGNIRMLINRGPRLQEPPLPAAQGQATGGQQPGTPRCAESGKPHNMPTFVRFPLSLRANNNMDNCKQRGHRYQDANRLAADIATIYWL